MPHVTQEAKDRVALVYQPKGSPQNAGEMNYLFSLIIQRYLAEFGKNYQHINDCLGALGCASQEFYRKVVIPYEDQKIKENGDAYFI